MQVPLSTGANNLLIEGLDSKGIPVAKASQWIYATYKGSNASPVVINEFMANNARTIFQCDRRFDDWIELYNSSDSMVDLSGYLLTDSLASLTKWRMPAGTKIGPREFLLVWADDGDASCFGAHQSEPA